MEERLVELSDQEVLIDFTLGQKCRTSMHLKSLSTTTPIAFKVQTSSPHKFLVSPPTGLIPPLSTATFQIVLKPQTQLPSSFPRSPSDRFLVKTALATPQITGPDSINSWFTHQLNTNDHKLKVAYVGVFLLRHAVSNGDFDAVKHIMKRQKSLSASEAEYLIQTAAELHNTEKIINLLRQAVPKTNACVSLDSCKDKEEIPPQFEATEENVRSAKENVEKIYEWGDSVLTAARRGEAEHLELLLKEGASINQRDQYGLTTLHAAAIKGHKDIVSLLIAYGIDIECQDKEGHTALHLAVEGGNMDTVRKLVDKGANVNAVSKRGCTPLYMAKAMGYDDISQFLLNRGASCTSLSSPSASSLSSL